MQRTITILVVLLGICLVVAGLYLIVLGPDGTIAQTKAASIKPGDQEIAWLHPATNIATWERFVAGLKEVTGVSIDDSAAFPNDSMKLPVIGLRKAGVAGTLWIRWYKLTGQRTIEHWVTDLCHRQPAPLAIVGGGNSERARDIAIQLNRLQNKQTSASSKLPLFLITTATADKVQSQELGEVDLMNIYAERSFRYCFTNKQMADAITEFVRETINKDQGLQITSSRISLISWHDDPFSEDLCDQFEELWRIPNETRSDPPVWLHRIAHSVGGLNQPNKLEVAAVTKLIKEASSESIVLRSRELLVLPGGPAPARRFLRSLYRTDPIERNFWVVAVGDAIDWNTLYRDRRLTWSIEDVPFPLIAFMHRNPVEQHLSPTRRFVPDSNTSIAPNPTGTDDLLLYRDIGQSLFQGCFQNGQLVNDPDQLQQQLLEEKDKQGQRSFDEQGNRLGGGGEYITLLRPQYENLRVLPKSKIEVYERQAAGQQWKRIITLDADYTNPDGTRVQP